MDIHDGVELVVFARQEDFGLDAVDECFQFLQLRCELVAYGFAFAGEFHQRFTVFELCGYLAAEIERLLKAGTLTEDLAGAFLVGIEVGFGNLLLYLIQLTLLCIQVKETSALPRCAS
jgi:hypothetical protein